jgi:hypothetical protein
VLAVIATLVAVSVLLPIAGTAAAVAILGALRAADLTSTWLGRRQSRPGRAAGAAAAVAFAPVAVLRSLLHLLAVLPLALLFAAGAGGVALLATPDPARAGGYAAGAFVACYGLGPGSGRSRKPLRKFFGAVTGTAPSAVVAFIGMTALALGTVAAAASLPPYVWPAIHLSHYLDNLPLVRGIRDLPKLFGQWRASVAPLTRWLGL